MKQFLALFLLLFSMAASALTLDEARAHGWVGERPDGYVGMVVEKPDVRSLVDQVNAKRKAAYERIARKNNLPVNEVARLAAEKLRQKLPAGTLVWRDGKWVRLP
ncbi:MAG: DUF1318 domain-containing protein [Gammaproteobacteria bacterium]|nr:MAG: DUF1318 domain-containing protein [Gammaproteobacteria bacterium]